VIGIDTNVLARFFLDDDPVASPIATRFLEHDLSAERPGYINPLTLAELVSTLRRHPRFDRSGLVTLLEDLLAFENVVVGESACVSRALAAYKAGDAGFVDYLIAELNAAAGASPTVTFDREARLRDPFSPLS